METFKLLGQDFANLLLVTALVLYAASRVARQQWETVSANRLREAIAWLLYAFAVVLMIASLAHLPGCEKSRDQPSVQGQQIEQRPAMKGSERPMAQQQK